MPVPSASASTPHSISRAPCTPASTTTRGSCRRASSIAAAAGRAVGDPADPEAGTGPCRLHEHGTSSVAHPRQHPRPVVGQSRSVMTTYGAWPGRPRRTAPSCAPCPWPPPRRRRRTRRRAPPPARAGPGWCRPRPSGPCRTGKTTSTACSSTGTSAAARTCQPRGRGVGGQRHLAPAGVTVGSRPPLMASAVGVVGRQHPAPVRGDADRHDVVPVPVQGAQHAAGADAGDRVLAGAAAEDHGDADPLGGGLVRGGLGHGAQPTPSPPARSPPPGRPARPARPAARKLARHPASAIDRFGQELRPAILER